MQKNAQNETNLTHTQNQKEQETANNEEENFQKKSIDFTKPIYMTSEYTALICESTGFNFGETGEITYNYASHYEPISFTRYSN